MLNEAVGKGDNFTFPDSVKKVNPAFNKYLVGGKLTLASVKARLNNLYTGIKKKILPQAV